MTTLTRTVSGLVALVAAVAIVSAPATTANAQSAPPGSAAAALAKATSSVSPQGDIKWNIPETSCAPLGDVVWSQVPFFPAVVGYQYTVVSAVETFDVSDARLVENQLDAPASATFTANLSKTFTVQTMLTFTTAQPLVDKFNATISVTIVQAVQTQIGVSTTAMVPAHGRVLGEYGVTAFDVVYDARMVFTDRQTGRCYDGGTTRASANAPTFVEGWRLRTV